MTTKQRVRMTLLSLLSALSVCAASSTLSEKSTVSANTPAGNAKLAPEFQTLYAQFSAGYANRDIEALMSVFDKSVVLSYQDTPDTNYEAIKAGFEYDFKNDPPGTLWKGFPEESHQSGDLAVVIAHWVHQTTRNGSTVTNQRIRSVDVFKRVQGKWKIVRTINYPEA